MAESWQEGGRESLLIDLVDDPLNDLCSTNNAAIVDRLLRMTDRVTGMPCVGLLGLEPECSSWSRARGGGLGPPAIRKKECQTNHNYFQNQDNAFLQQSSKLAGEEVKLVIV